MTRDIKYDLKQVLAEIEEDLSVEYKDMAQEVDISQSVIMNLLRKEGIRQRDDNQSPREDG